MVRRSRWRPLHALAVSACLALLAGPSLAQSNDAAGIKAREPLEFVPFADDPLVGGKRLVSQNFKQLPQWDRVRKFMLDRTNLSRPEVEELIAWAQGLSGKPPRERLYAINSRVNRQFKYVIDPRVWNKPDYWATPVENESKGRMDCEDFASVKLYLAYAAGIDPARLALLVGKIPSTGEAHAVMLAGAGRAGYILDNRSPYVVDTNAFADFKVFYAVDFNEIWIYPSAFRG